ncbi:molybdate ABC transporter substrate-binding protein [uncultured Maritalea sp.]|uniref:molybdate ABC transporter substrate-binding protein n=1 Tax=uncultured Maritalea sp. TaxID=757249 RepID=UPI002614D4F3|nr:molybdate ABC transporter substrate-binding protein [uncultured Maritalea sp.]
MRRFGFALAMLVGLIAQPAMADAKVFVAASLADVVQALVDASDIKGLIVVAGSSSSLARQIKAGAPADVFISANKDWAALVAGEQDLLPLFSNRLVLVSHKDVTLSDISELPSLLGNNRLAVGDPNHVPAGIYAREALKSLGLWDALQNNLAPADNVRAAVRLVQTGAAPFGIVYASDAALLKLNVVYVFDETAHSPISYWAVTLADQEPETLAFMRFLGSADAHAIVASYGFLSLEGK